MYRIIIHKVETTPVRISQAEDVFLSERMEVIIEAHFLAEKLVDEVVLLQKLTVE